MICKDGFPAEMFINAGDGMIDCITNLFNSIKDDVPPDQWDENHRGIFLTQVICKIFERVIKQRIEPKLKNIHRCQAGGMKNRSTTDNVFMLKGIIDHRIYTGEPTYVTLYDFKQAFDSLWLEDCILSLHNLGMEDELLYLIYCLNKNADIAVKNPYGLADAFKATNVVKQGTVLGPIFCSSSIAEYCTVNKGVNVGNIKISSLVFMDDIIDVSKCFYDACNSHENAISFADQKKLEYNIPKCKTTVVSTKKKLEPPTLYIKGENIKKVSSFEYLGDHFNDKGTNCDLILTRCKEGTATIISTMSTVLELDLGKYTIPALTLAYKQIFIPSFLFNSQAWSKLTNKDVEELSKIQKNFLRRILNVPSSTPLSVMYLELGVLPIKYEIIKNRLKYLHHILTLSDVDPLKKMYNNMKTNEGEENWANEVETLIQTYDILCSEQIALMSPQAYKAYINKKFETIGLETLKGDCRSKKKTENLSYRNLELQPYLYLMDPSKSRIIFRARSHMLNTKNDMKNKFANQNTCCRLCNSADESIYHIVNCGQEEMIPLDSICKIYNENINIKEASEIADRIENFIKEVNEN